MNEAETRAEHIDPALTVAGWGVVEGSRIRREYLIAPGRLEGHGPRAKPEIADYILEFRNHKLGVIEAKAWDFGVHRRFNPGEELRGQARGAFRLRHERPGNLRSGYEDRRGG